MHPWRPIYRLLWKLNMWSTAREFATGKTTTYPDTDSFLAVLDAIPAGKATRMHRADDWCHRSRLPRWSYRWLCDWQEMRVTGRPWGAS